MHHCYIHLVHFTTLCAKEMTIGRHSEVVARVSSKVSLPNGCRLHQSCIVLAYFDLHCLCTLYLICRTHVNHNSFSHLCENARFSLRHEDALNLYAWCNHTLCIFTVSPNQCVTAIEKAAQSLGPFLDLCALGQVDPFGSSSLWGFIQWVLHLNRIQRPEDL